MHAGAVLVAGDLLAVFAEDGDASALLFGAEGDHQLRLSASWMATPWCGAAALYVSPFGMPVARSSGSNDGDFAGAVGEQDGGCRRG